MYRITIAGQRLMMHSEQLANPFNEYTQELHKVSKKRGKTLDDHEELARIEFQGGLYFDEKAGPYFPAHCLHKMMVEGARRRKLGKEFSQNVLVANEVNPVQYEGPRTRKALWEQRERFADQRLVGVAKARCLRTRPLFRDWSITFDVKVAPGTIDKSSLVAALEAAQSIGLGDGRPVYAGQFTLEAVEEVKTK